MEVHLNILEGVADRICHVALRQSENATRRVPSPRFMRCRLVRKLDHQVKLDPRHGRVLRPEPFPGRNLRHHRRARHLLEPTAPSRLCRRNSARADYAPTMCFSSPMEPPRRTRWLTAVTKPGDIVIVVDRNCHKSHHYGMVLSGYQPLYVEAFPMTEYSRPGRCRCGRSSRRC